MIESTLYYWLSDNPLVLRYVAPYGADIGNCLPETKLYRLPIYYWHTSADAVEQYHIRAKSLRPRHFLHHLINEQALSLELAARGIPAVFCSHNAMIDERIFDVDPGAVKRFDAVYNARMDPFKRHLLARDVRSLYIVGGILTGTDSAAYFTEVRAALCHAEFSHAHEQTRWFGANDVARQIRQARVGLCLSACEGAMYAATEYLLCGLPIVSTASLGGRDEWFDTRYVRIAADDPAAVAEAVNELVRLNFDPQWIRQETLRRLWPHRRRLIGLVQDIFDAEMVGRDFAREWYPRFVNKMGDWRAVGKVMDFLQTDCPR